MAETKSTCPYCGVGCGVIIEHDGRHMSGVRGDPDHSANFGRLCTKGATLHLTATPIVMQTRRLQQPKWHGETLEWEAMNERLATRLAEIHAAHGPQAIGFYISGQLLTEDYHAFNKLARGVIGTNHIDSNSRLCMSSAVVGYKQALGADAPPCSYEDLDAADCVLVAGANPAWAHPVLFRRLEAARATKPNQKLIVIDPRRTETAELADLHLQLRPGTDVALFHGLLHLMIWEGWLDSNFILRRTDGFEALKNLVREMTPAKVARICGVPEADLRRAALWFATAGASLSLYCMGLNQSSSGTAKNTALINLHLATGQIGKPGAGPFSLTGQPNAMGGRETGGMATLLPGHRDPKEPTHRAEIAQAWGVDALPAWQGKTAVELFEAAAAGEIKALWIACTNPAQSLPDQDLVRRALARCELVILQEAFADTATAAFAHVLLPAATWGEKEGTVTNSERRVSRVRRAVKPPGQARADWRIARDVGRRLEALMRPGKPSVFGAETAEQLWLEHRATTRGRDLDITGLSYALLDAQGPQQWPFPEGAAHGMARLYTDHRFATSNGRARFIAKAYQAPLDAPNAKQPFALTTGRLRDQWHGMSRSGVVPKLFGHDGTPSVAMHPQDMARRALVEGDLVRVSNPRGSQVLPLRADATLRLSQAHAPMHWGSEFVAGAGINAVTQRGACPDARQPELKFASVDLQRAELPWRISAAAWVQVASGAALQQGLRALMPTFGYAHCVPVPGADGQEGWSFEAAAAEAPAPEITQQLTRLLGLHGAGLLRYADARKGRSRLLALDGVGEAATLRALLLVGEAGVARWLLPLWRERAPVQPYSRRLLAPDTVAEAPRRSPQVCNCFDLSQERIEAELKQCSGTAEQRLVAVQRELKCGTQCGSCLPALRRIVLRSKEEVTS